MTRVILNFLFILIYLPAFAGDVKGNGAGALLCPGQKLEILDYYEAQLRGYGQLKLGEDQSTQEEMIQAYLSRLAIYAPRRAELYSIWAQNFENDAIFLDGIPIDNIDDVGVTLPKDCEWHQVINQNPLLLPAGKKYLIDRVLWGQMTMIQKVGLVFHELLYRESASQTSKGLRRLNALIVTDKINTMNLMDRIELFNQAGLSWFEAQGLAFRLDREIHIENNILRKAYAVKDSEYIWKNHILKPHSDVVEFHENGSLKSLKLTNPLIFNFMGENLEFETFEYSLLPIHFYDSGELKEGPLNWFKTWKITNENLNIQYEYIHLNLQGQREFVDQAQGYFKWDGKVYPIQNKSKVTFFSNQQLKSVLWGTDAALSIWGQQVYPKYATQVNFSQDGAINNFTAAKDGRLKNAVNKWIIFRKDEVVSLQ